MSAVFVDIDISLKFSLSSYLFVSNFTVDNLLKSHLSIVITPKKIIAPIIIKVAPIISQIFSFLLILRPPLINHITRYVFYQDVLIIIGISKPVHTEEQLKEFAENSKNKYDLTQQQRAMETKLRSLKTRRLAASAAGDELEAKRLQRKINKQQTIYRRFSEKHNLLYDTQRASVQGYRRISVKGLQIDNKSVIIEQVRKTMISLIESGELPLNLNIGNQNKHIINQNKPSFDNHRSYIIGGLKEAQELVEQYHGKGEVRVDTKGQWTNKEFIIVDRDIGYVYNPETNEFEPTNRFSIHYGKKGTHVVPRKRLKNETV